MFLLHQQYLTQLKPNNKFVNRAMVIDYVNKLNPSQLMFLLNYNFRKNNIKILEHFQNESKS
jgi:hypothetical protein